MDGLSKAHLGQHQRGGPHPAEGCQMEEALSTRKTPLQGLPRGGHTELGKCLGVEWEGEEKRSLEFRV